MQLPLVESLISLRKRQLSGFERFWDGNNSMQYLHVSLMTHALVLVMHVLGSLLTWHKSRVRNVNFLSPKTIKKLDLITVEHDRCYPSSVDDLYSMSLLYWSILFLSQEKRKSIKVKIAYGSFHDCLNNLCLHFCALNCRFKTSVSRVLKVLSVWGGYARP